MHCCYDILGIELKWFSDYLSNRRSQCVYVNGVLSIMQVVFGIPQGSSLSPLLFFYYLLTIYHYVFNQHYVICKQTTH